MGLLVGLLILGASELHAQDLPEGPAYIQQADQSGAAPQWFNDSDIPEAALIQTVLNESQSLQNTILQNGQEHPGQQTFLLQRGTSNSAEVHQQGTSNLAAILQVGSFNSTTVTQRGDHNAAGVGLKGSHNAVELFQQGDNNRYLFSFTGSHLDKTGPNRLEQIGNGNTMIEVGQNSIPFNIQQRGDGMRMIIRHNTPQ